MITEHQRCDWHYLQQRFVFNELILNGTGVRVGLTLYCIVLRSRQGRIRRLKMDLDLELR